MIYTSTERRVLRANPVLLQFRQQVDSLVGGWERVSGEASWWLWLMEQDPYFENANYWGSTFLRDHATLRHVIHARRVLGLIEAVFGPETEKVREEPVPGSSRIINRQPATVTLKG